MIKVSFVAFDLIRGALEGNVFGSTAFMMFIIVMGVLLLLILARMPAYFAILIASPLLIAFSQLGLIPPLIQGVVIFIIFGILGFLFIKLFASYF